MPKYHLTSPDGAEYEVEAPEGATEQDAINYIQQNNIEPMQKAAPQQVAQQPASAAESFARGGIQGATLGFGDEIMGGIGAGVARLIRPDLFKNQSFGDTYAEGRDIARSDEAVARQSNPWWYGGGQLAGSVATGAKIPFPASTAGKYATGMGLGAVAGYGNSEAKSNSGQIYDTLAGAGFGAAGTYVGDKIGRGINAIVNSKPVQSTKNTLAQFYQTPKAVPAVPQNPAIVEAMANGATPEEAAIIAKAKEYSVPLSRGDVTRQVEQQGLEDLALRGGLGQDAATTAKAFRDQQSLALKNAAQNLSSKVSGAPFMDNQADVGGALSGRLKAIASAEDANVNTAYEAVKKAGDAKIAVPFLNKHMQGAVDELKQYPLDTMPSTRSVLGRMGNVLQENEGGKFTAPIDLQKLDNFRKFINRAGSSVQIGNNSDKAGVQILKGKLDSAIDDAINNNLVYGNPEAIGKLKDAREMARGYFQRWKADDAVQKIVENEYTPEQVLNLVRGYGQVGGNKQAAQLVDKLGTILGKDSQEFAMLKQAQLRQIFGKNLDSLLAGDVQKGFSAEEINKNLTNLLNNNKSLANAYFSPQEQKTLKDFLDVAYRATNRVAGAVNTSNTTPALLRAGRQFANQFGFIGRLLGAPAELAAQGMGGIKNGVRAQEAIDSFSPQFNNPNNAFTSALRDKLTNAGSAAGAIDAGSQAGTKQRLKIEITPKKPDKQSYNQLFSRFYA